MGNRVAGIMGGLLCIVCASGVFAMYWFVIQPANGTLAWGQTELGLYVSETQLNQTIIGVNWSASFYPPFVNETTGEIFLIDAAMKMAPITVVNFWGVISIDIFICFLILIGLGGLGGILALAGAGED
jgi:hypothetical protein